MTTLHERARVAAESVTGYAYDAARMDAIIDGGTIPDGATLAVAGNQRIIYHADRIDCVVDGAVAKSTPMTPAAHEAALVQYAVTESRLGTHVGA